MRRKMPLKPCVRCGRRTERRRSGRPTCLVCNVQLEELRADNAMRRMGKLKNTADDADREWGQTPRRRRRHLKCDGLRGSDPLLQNKVQGLALTEQCLALAVPPHSTFCSSALVQNRYFQP